MPRLSTTLSIGSAAPDFNLPAVNGEAVGLWDCLLSGPVVVEFIRGTWCPDGRERLREITAINDAFEQQKTRLVVVVCEAPDTVARHISKHPVPVTVLVDADRKVARDYGVYQRFGIDRWNLARPATFLVDRAGYVRRIFVARIRNQREDLDEVLAFLHEIE